MMFPNFKIGYDAYVDDDGVLQPGGAIEHIPGGAICWEGGIGTVRMSCQKCHPDWTDNEVHDPGCDLCGGEGVKTRTIKTRAREERDADTD
jgi:hypothetical protein